MRDDIEIEVEVRGESQLALLVFDGKEEVWVPKSQISDQSERADGSVESIFIPEWLALKNGLI